MSTTLATLLEQKRRQLVHIQEEIATLERAQALLAGRPVRPTGPGAAPASRPAATRPRPAGSPLKPLVLHTLRTSATPLSPRAIAAKLAARGRRVTRGRLTSLLSELIRAGTLRRPSPGLYALASASASPAAPSSGAPTASPPRPSPAPAAGPSGRPAASAKRPRRR